MNKKLSKKQISRIEKIIEICEYSEKRDWIIKVFSLKDNPDYHISTWENIVKTLDNIKKSSNPLYDKEKEAVIELLRFIAYTKTVYLDCIKLDSGKVPELVEIYKNSSGQKDIDVTIKKNYQGWDPFKLLYNQDNTQKAITLRQECYKYYIENQKDYQKTAKKLFEVHNDLINEREVFNALELGGQRIRLGVINKEEGPQTKEEEVDIYLSLAYYQALKRNKNFTWTKQRIYKNADLMKETDKTMDLIYQTVKSDKCMLQEPHPLMIYCYGVELAKLSLAKEKVLDLINKIINTLKDNSKLTDDEIVKYLLVLQFAPIIL